MEYNDSKAATPLVNEKALRLYIVCDTLYSMAKRTVL